MSRTGAAAVSTFRILLRHSYQRQRFGRCGFRLAPTPTPMVTTFALHLQQQSHRTFSSSASSTTSHDDEPNGRKNLDKHKKQLDMGDASGIQNSMFVFNMLLPSLFPVTSVCQVAG
ncbi:uncharacterized protein Dwil_GK27527 [Drosophila willistoni]|uniref:Uncharacterized protein n=1 Tax=Drosophila willistoni TaxID=7260 RepID=A0A0Q9WSL9_DROWI|nr:uncharacterized protein Dwil_GK27527 [Drosophila willistoni]